jgi:hypothetical protein
MEGDMPVKPGTEPHIETYAMEMASIIGKDPEMRHIPIAMTELMCRKLAYGARPQVTIIEESRSRFIFKVVSPPLASLVGGCLGNDTNSHLHAGEFAVMQSNAIIGICTDAVMRTLKGRLLKVDPLNFRDSLPVGTPVIVTIEMDERDRLGKRFGTIEVTREDGGTAVMKKAILTMSCE